MAVDRPLLEFSDISRNYIRLLNKDVKSGSKSKFDEKSQRPISELNVLPKYGSVKIFVEQLRNQVLGLMNDNQYASPGKGGPMAIVQTLDFAAMSAAQSKKTAIIFWDFSNAFCTTIHSLTESIASKYNLSDRMMELLGQFLKQTLSTIKMSDKNGIYFSDEIDVVRGNPQGQIGSDFIFAMINDGMSPEVILDEIIKRTKYVDDFTDTIVADLASTVFKSL